MGLVPEAVKKNCHSSFNYEILSSALFGFLFIHQKEIINANV